MMKHAIEVWTSLVSSSATIISDRTHLDSKFWMFFKTFISKRDRRSSAAEPSLRGVWNKLFASVTNTACRFSASSSGLSRHHSGSKSSARRYLTSFPYFPTLPYFLVGFPGVPLI